MSKAQNPFTFAERLKNHGYAQFFGFKDPISSYGSWTEKQIISLQMLIVDPGERGIEELRAKFGSRKSRSVRKYYRFRCNPRQA